MPRPRRPDRERRSDTKQLPQSLWRYLMGEISQKEAFHAEPELASIRSPVPSFDGSWDGLDNFLVLSGLADFFADNPGLLDEALAAYEEVHPGEQPPWLPRVVPEKR